MHALQQYNVHIRTRSPVQCSLRERRTPIPAPKLPNAVFLQSTRHFCDFDFAPGARLICFLAVGLSFRSHIGRVRVAGHVAPKLESGHQSQGMPARFPWSSSVDSGSKTRICCREPMSSRACESPVSLVHCNVILSCCSILTHCIQLCALLYDLVLVVHLHSTDERAAVTTFLIHLPPIHHRIPPSPSPSHPPLCSSCDTTTHIHTPASTSTRASTACH